MIRVENANKTFGSNQALNIEYLEIPKGEIFGLVGNNGAGKTTLFNAILDLIRINTGHIHSKDQDVAKSGEWKKYTGAYISEEFLISFLTPEEYFTFISELHNWKKADLDQFLIGFEEFFNGEILAQNKYIRDLSKGNQKKVGIAGALIGNTQIVLLDEPFANLDPSSQNRLKNLINQLNDGERTILISSHDINHIADVCTRIVVLEKGAIVRDIQKSEEALKELQNYFAV